MQYDGQGRLQTHIPKQQHRQRVAVSNGMRPHTEPPTRVASPFAADSFAYPPAAQQTQLESAETASSHQHAVPPLNAAAGDRQTHSAVNTSHAATSDRELSNVSAIAPTHAYTDLSHGLTPTHAVASQGQSTQDLPPGHAAQASTSDAAHVATADAHNAADAGDVPAVSSIDTALTNTPLRSQVGSSPVPQQPVLAASLEEGRQRHPSGAELQSGKTAVGALQYPQTTSQSQPPSQPQPIPRSEARAVETDTLPHSGSSAQLHASRLPPLQSVSEAMPQALATSQSHVHSVAQPLSHSLPHTSSTTPQHPPPQSYSHSFPQAHPSLHAVSESVSVTQHSAAGQAVPMPSYASSAIPVMASMQYPVQGFMSAMHLPGSQGEMYPYGMMQMLHPSMLMLPQQQQQQHHTRGTRNGRSGSGAGPSSGISLSHPQHSLFAITCILLVCIIKDCPVAVAALQMAAKLKALDLQI